MSSCDRRYDLVLSSIRERYGEAPISQKNNLITAISTYGITVPQKSCLGVCFSSFSRDQATNGMSA